MSTPDVITGCAVDAPALQRPAPQHIVWHLDTKTGDAEMNGTSIKSTVNVPQLTFGSSVRVLIGSMPVQTRRLLRQTLTMVPVDSNNGPVQQLGPVQQGPVQQGPVQQGPVQQGPVQLGPVQKGPVQKASSQNRSSKKAQVQKTYQLYTKVNVSSSTAPGLAETFTAVAPPKPMPFKRKIAGTIQKRSNNLTGKGDASNPQNTVAFLPRAFVIDALTAQQSNHLWRSCNLPFNNQAETKSIETKSIESKSLDTESIETKSIESKSIETKSIESKSIESKSIESKSIESKSIESKSIKSKSIKSKSLDTESIKTKSIESKSVDIKSCGFSVFSGTLHDYQEAACKHVLDKLQNDKFHGGLLTAGCGVGKTTMALHVAHTLKVRTAILVHTNVLLGQWQEKIKQYLPHARVGVLQGKRRPKPDDEFCVCMLPSTAKLDLSEAATVTGAYGLLIADECHHICCRTFSQALARFKTPYMLGLTATPERTDRLGYAIEWLIGPVIYTIKRDTPRVQVLMCKYVNPRFRHATYKWNSEKMDYTTTMTWIVRDKWRTRRFAELIHALAGGERRTILALSNRVCLLENLNVLLPQAGLLIGKKSDAQREDAKLRRIVLASACLADEGLDVPGFDTLAQATPCRCKREEANGKLEQRLGRILRGKSDDVPLVVDFYDGYKMFAGMAQARRKWYASKGYGFRKTVACLRPTMPGDSDDVLLTEDEGALSQEEEAKLKADIASQFPPISPYSATTWDECNTPLPDHDDPAVIATLQASGWSRQAPTAKRASTSSASSFPPKEPKEYKQVKTPTYDYIGCFDQMMSAAT